jgi:hypothetical protein
MGFAGHEYMNGGLLMRSSRTLEKRREERTTKKRKPQKHEDRKENLCRNR